MGKLSQAIAEGDGITFIVEVDDAPATHAAVKQGADAVASRRGIHQVRAASQVPMLAFGSLIDAKGVGADAIAIEPQPTLFFEAEAYGLESVVRVSDGDAIQKALRDFNPEIFLLSASADSDEDVLTALLELLHDVPAGKLAIAELHDATAEEVAELERSGVDAVLVSPGDLSTLVPASPPDV